MRQDQGAKVAIVLVPGYYNTPQPGWPRDRLAAILAKASGTAPPRNVTAAGEAGLRLAMPGPAPFDLDLFEFSWKVPEQSISNPPFALPLRAWRVTRYWIGGWLRPNQASEIKDKTKDDKEARTKEAGTLATIFLTSGVIAFFVMLWWAVLILLLIQEAGLLQLLGLKLFGDSRVWAAGIGLLAAGFWSWTPDLLRRFEYMRNYLSSPPESPYRAVVRAQLLDLLLRLSEATYERVLLVAHSYGAVIAVDLLGSVPPPECPPLHLVTMASPFVGLRLWAEWIDDAVKEAFNKVPAWTDLYAPTDMLCGPVPGHVEQFGPEASFKLEFGEPWQRASLQTHDCYLDDEETARHIAEAAKALVAKTKA